MAKGNSHPVTLRRTAFWCGAGLAALLGIAVLAAALAVSRPHLFLPLVRRALAPRGGSATVADLKLSLRPPALTLSGLAVAGPPREGDLLRMDHVRVELIPARLFRGGPWLRRVEARGVDFTRLRARETRGPTDLTPLTRLFDIEELSLTDARLRVALPQGDLAVDGLRLSLFPGEGGIRSFAGQGELIFRRNGAAVAKGKLAARGKVTPGPAIDVDLELATARLELPWLSGDLFGQSTLKVTRRSLQAEDVRLNLLQARLGPGPRAQRPLGQVRLDGAGSATLDGREPRLEVRGLDVGGLFLARGRMSGPTLEELSGTLDGDVPRVERLIALVSPLLPGPLEGMELTGRLRFRLGLERRLALADGGPRVAAAVALDEIGFRSRAGDAMGRNLGGRLDLEGFLSHPSRIKADLSIGRGEALWGTVYVDLAQDPLKIHARMTRKGPDEYQDLLLDGAPGGFGRLTLEGKAWRAGGIWRHRGRLLLDEAPLGPIFRTFLRDPLVTSHPDLAGLRMDGTARVELAFSGSMKAAELDGRLRLRSGDVRREGDPPVLSGLDIDLPIAYSLGVPDPARPRPPATAGWGRLSIRELRLAGQELGPLEMPVVLVPNRLYIGEGVDASLFGGRVLLRQIRVDEPFSPRFNIHLAARLDGIDLARLAGTDPMLEGRLGGLLDPVQIGRERLTASGDLSGDLFGGRVDVRRVTVDRPFGAGREIGADVSLGLLDLERLSAALGVGRVTGRISGSLAGLRVAYGQPVAFHLKMESVQAEGVTQLVSLKAVNSISLVSTGSSLSGLGSSLMTTFFREFPYAKIGFECHLENDVFTVRGLIHEDGIEYLVKRRLFSGINVINRNPDNRIGFSDMLERAKRVTGERPD
jgi:hypothetical protein